MKNIRGCVLCRAQIAGAQFLVELISQRFKIRENREMKDPRNISAIRYALRMPTLVYCLRRSYWNSILLQNTCTEHCVGVHAVCYDD